MENTEFVCFTSACGGSGCSSAARTFARICSKILKKRVLLISLDLMSEKSLPVSAGSRYLKDLCTDIPFGNGCAKISFGIYADEFGVSYLRGEGFINPLHDLSDLQLDAFLSKLAGTGDWDLAVLDIPFRNRNSELLCMCCEKIVAVKGYLPSQSGPSDSLFARLRGHIEKLDEKPELYAFSPMEDAESFGEDDVDIHDQFGAEVRLLAEELFGPV